MLRFNKALVRECEYNWEKTLVLEVNYSLDGEKWLAQIKDFHEYNRKKILKSLRWHILNPSK